jgi:hypothetical protein
VSVDTGPKPDQLPPGTHNHATDGSLAEMTRKTPPFRISVVVEGDAIAPWQLPIFEELLSSDDFILASVIKRPAQSPLIQASPIVRAVDRLERLVAGWFFRRVFAGTRKMRDRPLALSDKLSGETAILTGSQSTSRKGGGAEAVDIVLDLTGRPDTDAGDLPDNTRLWWLVIGHAPDGLKPDAVPDGFDEVRNASYSIETTLWQLTAEDKRPRLLNRGVFRTFLWSWSENERQLRYKAAYLIVDHLRALRAAKPQPRPAAPAPVSGPHGSGSFAAIAALAKCWWRIISETFERVVREERWCLYITPGTPLDCDFTRAQRISPPQSSYWADPFPIERDGKTIVYFEEYPYSTSRGLISCAELTNDDGEVKAVGHHTILEQPHHLSYPFLFEQSGELYMIPESSADRTIGLWRCEEFPHRWAKVHDVMEGISATDTTLFEHQGRWWLFTNIDRADIHDHCSELHAFSSPDPLSRDWTPHPLNPIVRDARAARMAGPVYRTEDGCLIRPAQVNTRYYGYAITLFEIVDLSPATYEEIGRRHIEPNWRRGISRNHHIASVADRVIIDACHQRFKLERYVARILRRH